MTGKFNSVRNGKMIRPVACLSLICWLSLFCPAAVTGQSASENSTITLYWTAPGDDNYAGRAFLYDIRYSTSPFIGDTIQWWNSAIPTPSVSIPSLPGARDSCKITGLRTDRVYRFAVRTADEAFNWSPISNIVTFPSLSCADMNGDGLFTNLDIIYILAYFYSGGSPPVFPSGDVDNSGSINIMDAVYLVKFQYEYGSPPDCGK